MFLTSMCQNASRFVIFSVTNFYIRRRKVSRAFLHLACGRHVSLRHVVAIDPLIDSIPESSIDGWASAVLHLTGANFFEVVPTTINLLGSRNFRLSSHSHLPSPFTTHVDHRDVSVALRRCASVQERYIR